MCLNSRDIGHIFIFSKKHLGMKTIISEIKIQLNVIQGKLAMAQDK